MDVLIHLVTAYGLWFVFVNVLVEQLGVPLPAYPVLMTTGALAARGDLGLGALLATAVGACLLADGAWYLIGAWFGRRVLRLLCRISLSPDSCVRQTESIFVRFGPASLVVSKFVPGFATVATALAGAMRIRPAPFLVFDALGATAWVGAGLALGWFFAGAVDHILGMLARFGRWGALLLLTGAATVVVVKWRQRRRFAQQLRMARLTVNELSALIAAGERPLIVDVRSALSSAEGRIPGAILLPKDGLPAELAHHPKDRLVVVYCACPNDASAVMAARRLTGEGFSNVRALAGGVDAWTADGRELAPA